MKTLFGSSKSIDKTELPRSSFLWGGPLSDFPPSRVSLRKVAILLFFLLIVCLVHTSIWAQSAPITTPQKDIWGSPNAVVPSQGGIKNDTPQIDSASVTAGTTFKNSNERVADVVEEFIQQFANGKTCFGSVVNLGNPAAFRKDLAQVIVLHRPSEPPRLVTYKQGGLFGVRQTPQNEMRVPFNPQTGKPSFDQKLKLYHESIHQIEALRNAVRDNGKSGAERNTEYASEVVVALKAWSDFELRLKNHLPIAEDQNPLEKLGELEMAIRDAESKWHPDKELVVWAGIKVEFDKILSLYLSNACGPELKALADRYMKLRKPIDPVANQAIIGFSELYGCLCRCAINPTTGVGATYDPKAWKNASPSCDDARNGPCVGSGLGCWRKHMLSAGKCFDQCVETANAKPQEVKTEIYQTRFKAYNDFLGEARSIIEEYLAYTAKFNQKRSDRGGSGINRDFIQLAGNFPDDATLGQIIFAAASARSAPTSYAEMVREKNRRGDPDKALGLVRSAEAVMPERKASGETTNILAEFAITMSKASLNIVTELEFDEGIYLLRKAAEFNTAGKSSPLGENIKRLTGNFEKWKENWQILKSEIPGCIALIKDKRVCECDRLNSEKITPAANSLTIYEFASSEKWSISTANGIPRAIPEKDKIYNELKDKLSKAKNECANNPAMNTKEMKNLTDYDTRKSLEKSPYINQQDLEKNSASVICDTRAVKNAEKLLSAPGLCDCQQEKIKGILDTAKKDERPLVIEFGADKKELAVGERVMLSLSIKGGRPPFSADMIGDYPYTMRSEARGFNINYQAGKAGTNNFYVTVVDSCGDSGSKKISINVKQSKSSKILSPTTQETAKTSSPTQTPTSIKKQPPVYDPTKDRNIKDKGKAIDVDSVDSLSNEFNDASMKSKKPGSDKASQQTPIAQTDTYKGSEKKADETNEIKDPNQNYPPYSYPPQNDYKSGQGKDWAKWATNSKTKDSSSKKSNNWESDKTKDKGSTGVTTSDSSDKSSGLSITAVYENKSDQNVHIFTEGETFSPANRLAPGESRKVNVKMPANGIIKFYAGRNGQILSSKTWGGDPDHLDRYPMVRFTKGMEGKEILVITTNLK